jgi:spermidine synthase
MSRFAELAVESTPMGELVLRRRFDPSVDQEVYEVKLGDEFLMSSLFTDAEQELARVGLAAASGAALDVVVGGLGLGYTAVTALEDARTASLVVVDALPAVIDWHERHLLPVSERLVDDPRTRLVAADFFAYARGEQTQSVVPGLVDVILLDVDHTPQHTLHPSHADLYTPEGFSRLRDRLRPGGVFALWSDEPPHESTLADLRSAFSEVNGSVVTFANPLTGGTSTNGLYVARRNGGDQTGR